MFSDSLQVSQAEPGAAQQPLWHQEYNQHDKEYYSPSIQGVDDVSGVGVTVETSPRAHAIAALNLQLVHQSETGDSNDSCYQALNPSSHQLLNDTLASGCGLYRSKHLESSNTEIVPDAREDTRTVGMVIPILKSYPRERGDHQGLGAPGAPVAGESRSIDLEQQCSRTRNQDEVTATGGQPLMGHCWTGTIAQIRTSLGSGQNAGCIEKINFSRDTDDSKIEESADYVADGQGPEIMTDSVGNHTVFEGLEGRIIADKPRSVEQVPAAYCITHCLVTDAQSGDFDCKGESEGFQVQYPGSWVGDSSVLYNQSANTGFTNESRSLLTLCPSVNRGGKYSDCAMDERETRVTGVSSESSIVSGCVGRDQSVHDHISGSVLATDYEGPSQDTTADILVVADLAWITS